MTKCMTRGIVWGAGIGAGIGLLTYFAVRGTTWATVKKVGIPLGAAAAVGLLAGFATKTSCESGRLSPAFRGLGAVPKGIKCPPMPKGISKAWQERGIKVELEHTNDRPTARCISAVHWNEDRRYYPKLVKMEAK